MNYIVCRLRSAALEYLTVVGVFGYPHWMTTAIQECIMSCSNAARCAQAHGGHAVLWDGDTEAFRERVDTVFS